MLVNNEKRFKNHVTFFCDSHPFEKNIRPGNEMETINMETRWWNRYNKLSTSCAFLGKVMLAKFLKKCMKAFLQNMLTITTKFHIFIHVRLTSIMFQGRSSQFTEQPEGTLPCITLSIKCALSCTSDLLLILETKHKLQK